MFVLRKYNKKQRLPQDYYDVPYHYTLPPLPPRVHRMDSGIYDIISNNDMESETAFSTAPVNSNEHEQSKIENGDVLSTGVIDTTGTEIFQNNNMSESDSMQNPPASEGSGMQENKIGENRAMAANINVESNRVVNESIFGVGAFGLQGDQEREKQVDALPSISHAYTAHAEEESITRAEVHVQLQENASYQPSTNFDFTANLAYGTDIAIAPEIPTEANIAYQHTSSSQLSSSPDDNFSSATQRNDSLVSDED